MTNKSYEELYDWKNAQKLFEKFVPELIDEQQNINSEEVSINLPEEKRIKITEIGFKNEGRNPEDVTRQLIDDVYPYRLKINHSRNFCFIPGAVTPYSVFGEFLNSINNPYGGSLAISGGTAEIEKETINYLGSLIGYDVAPLGGTFVSGGSMGNLTAAITARDDKLEKGEITKAVVYVSDQTHSSMAKGLHIIGIDRDNIRKISSDDYFRMNVDELEETIKKDIKDGYKPFLVVGSAGTTNTGSIDPLNEIADICEKYNLWYHIDGAYGASALLSSHKDKLKGIERSDSVTWDGHKWLFQTFGCAAIICKDKMKLLKSFHANPEYLKDVEATDDHFNFWDMGIELTRPARGMKLWFALQTIGLDDMKRAIDQGFAIADWIEEEVSKYDDFEIVSHSQMGIINFRYYNDKFTNEELDEINHRISRHALEKNYAAFLTTILKGKTVLRFCCNNALTTKDEIKIIIDDIRTWIDEETKDI